MESNTPYTSSSSSSTSSTWKGFLQYSGAGFLVAVAYVDPGNLEADLQGGAYSSYQLMWVLLFSFAVGLIFQYLSIKIGLLMGKHLAQICQEEYSPPVAMFLWIVSEISIVVCDVQGIIATAIALRILFNFPLALGALFTCFDLLTFIIIDFAEVDSHQVEWFFVALVTMMAVSFFWNFSINPPSAYPILFGTFVPTMDSSQNIRLAVGLIGSIILPQNYFMHSAIVLKNKLHRNDLNEVIRRATSFMTLDAVLALVVAFMINLTVISCFAELFYNKTCLDHSMTACLNLDLIDSSSHEEQVVCYDDRHEGVCGQIGLSDAGAALSGALGSRSSLIWAIGLLASAQSSTITVTYAGRYLSEGFAKARHHLIFFNEFQSKPFLHQRLLFCRSISLPISLLVVSLHSLYSYPSTFVDDVTQWGNFVASLCAPFAFLPMIRFCSTPHLMQQDHLSKSSSIALWLLSIVLIFANIYLIWNYLLASSFSTPWLAPFLGIVLTLLYLYGCFLTVKSDTFQLFSCDYSAKYLSLQLCSDEELPLHHPSKLNSFTSTSLSTSPSLEENDEPPAIPLTN